MSLIGRPFPARDEALIRQVHDRLLYPIWGDDVHDAARAVKSAGTKITTVGVGGTDLALLNTVSSDAGYAFSAAAFNNDAANIGDQVTAKLCERDGGLRRRHTRGYHLSVYGQRSTGRSSN